ncbi:cell division protein FtsA [Streptococcus ruminantium]|uniref:cell division protein FtsA n=1 Tax=Streptococcus ruminantium TaxID=1917441 RepID=UPI0003F5FAC1|nr:cell division protein FtsA [Streptococcus ruminantium]MDQ8765330.1 cell division protein FtsA [Streptococcus ruminantium]MDQ8767584.1 cell division protein FtsA [Streptococcus ruminantium]MDQ8780718.1 cell division protein FtsA [Streptococcus ruminantium]MDQ8821019.1 cell division protein FtsA [Streptococcus ruminantium]MDQ8837694.1 cell division protein FtsA [Streptococcus ruminantium]
MARSGFFTGLDIGTSSVKVLVAEYIDNEMNVIGVSNVKSAGVKDGIIVNIEVAAGAIKKAIEQAEEKSGIRIEKVNVGLPANLLQIEPTQGMIPVTTDSQEITDLDVENVVRSALTKSMTPEREVISFIPEEFTVDGFQGIKDPRGMMGIRLEMRGMLYTGPRTILHNLRKTVERAGVQVENIVISPLALTRSVLNEGEREFGATVIDLGGGQTTVAVMRGQELQYTNIYQEGGDYITNDISKVLTTSKSIAENLKYNYGVAYPQDASDKEKFTVEVIGESAPVEVTERYLSEVIAARLRQIFDRVKQDLERTRALDLPGGIVLVGGGAILPGITELAQEVLGVNTKIFVPNQIGIRNPAFASVISFVEYVGELEEVENIAQHAVNGETVLRHKPVDIPIARPRVSQPIQKEIVNELNTVDHEEEQTVPVYHDEEEIRPAAKSNITDRIRGLFGSMFE